MSACTPDFDSRDFNSSDFYTYVSNLRFGETLFLNLPDYFHINDSYKDSEGRGLLQRIFQIIGDEIDQEITPEIDCYLRIIDAQVCEDRFLIPLSDSLGNPPDIFGDDDMYRNLLSYICSVYKIKGTKKAYQLFFSLMGFNIDLIEIEPEGVTPEARYDNFGNYDSIDPKATYDQDFCKQCSQYDLILYQVIDSGLVWDESLYNRVLSAIKFNEPINARLRNLIFAVPINDNIIATTTDTATTNSEVVSLYDSNADYDNEEESTYDDEGELLPEYLLETIQLDVSKSGTAHNLIIKTPRLSLDDIDLLESRAILRAYENEVLIYEKVGYIIDAEIISGNLEGKLIAANLPIPTYDKLLLTLNLNQLGVNVGYNTKLNRFITEGTQNFNLYYILS